MSLGALFTTGKKPGIYARRRSFVSAQQVLRGKRSITLKHGSAETALNLAIDVARRRNQVQKHLEHPLTADLSVPGREHIDRALLVERVRILALRLPERQREVFLLRNFEDLSYAEIGSLVDCTPETARVNEYHAVQKIRVWLHVDQEDWEGEADDTGNV